MAIDTYDTSSKLNIAHDDLEKARFLKNSKNKIAVRVGNEQSNPLYVTSVDDNNVTVEELNIHDKAELVSKLIETLVVQYVVPPLKVLELDLIEGSGENTAKYTVKINDIPTRVKFSYYGASLNVDFNYNNGNGNGIKLPAGTKVELFVEHFVNDTPVDFFGSILGRLKDG